MKIRARAFRNQRGLSSNIRNSDVELLFSREKGENARQKIILARSRYNRALMKQNNIHK